MQQTSAYTAASYASTSTSPSPKSTLPTYISARPWEPSSVLSDSDLRSVHICIQVFGTYVPYAAKATSSHRYDDQDLSPRPCLSVCPSRNVIFGKFGARPENVLSFEWCISECAPGKGKSPHLLTRDLKRAVCRPRSFPPSRRCKAVRVSHCTPRGKTGASRSKDPWPR